MRTGTSTTADRQYVWHPYYIDALAISYNSSGTAHYYVQDGNFNVTAAMDSSGAVVERYSYTPYGECIVFNADFTLDSSSGGDGLSGIANEFTYTGRRLDVETGLYQYRHRYYHAQLGRFVNRDPIGYLGSEWNLYEYVKSEPLILRDPFGKQWTGGRTPPPGMGSPLPDSPFTGPPHPCQVFAFNPICAIIARSIALEVERQFLDNDLPTHEGDNQGHNAMLHCTIACEINKRYPSCNETWNFREFNGPITSEMDLENNRQGQSLNVSC